MKISDIFNDNFLLEKLSSYKLSSIKPSKINDNLKKQSKALKRETLGGSPAEKLIKDIEYQKDDKDVAEGHGRYWCSTDRRWKTRKGPKKSRS